MEKGQLTIDFKYADISEYLNNVVTNKVLLLKILSLDEVELNRLSIVVSRIEQKGGSVKHYIRYLALVHLKPN